MNIETVSQTVTTQQIEALMNEAGVAGDLEQVALCKLALQGNDAALEACADVIAEAQASRS